MTKIVQSRASSSTLMWNVACEQQLAEDVGGELDSVDGGPRSPGHKRFYALLAEEERKLANSNHSQLLGAWLLVCLFCCPLIDDIAGQLSNLQAGCA